MKKETLAKFYQTYKLIVFPGVVALSGLILVSFVIYPQTTKLIQNYRFESDLKSKSILLEAKAESLENYDEVDLTRKVAYVLNAFPGEKDFFNILGLLETLMGQSGYNILSLSFGAGSVSEPGKQQSYQAKVEMLGPKAVLSRLLSSIEESSRIMRVNSLEISATRQAGIVSVILTIEVLFSALPSQFGTADSPLPTLSSQDEELIAKLAASAPSAVTPTEPVTLGPRGKVNPFE